jgi:hypothetical protein
MKELKRKYLKLFKVELEDLSEDLQIMLDLNSDKKNRGEITNYVYMENVSLLQREITCLKDLMTYCDTVEVGQPNNLEELTDIYCRCLQERARESDYPKAVTHLVLRKMKKIAGYLATD